MILLFFSILGGNVSAQRQGSAASADCPDPPAVLTQFYSSNDMRAYAASVRLLWDNATIDTWATGVNGYIMARRHAKGTAEIRAFLAGGRGLSWHLPDSAADGPIYRQTLVKVSGNTVQFMLEPDRKRPNGKPYPPFSVEAVLDGCRIRTLTVIERVTWL